MCIRDRIERDEGDLRGDEGRRRFSGFDCGADEAFVTGVDERVDLFHAVGDGVLGNLLELRVERGVDAQSLLVVIRIAEALGELIADEVNEVGRLTGIESAGIEIEGRGLGLFGLSFGDGAGFYH